jgi:DNA primase
MDARELKRRANLLDIAGRFTRLRKSGGQYMGLCPLHYERHASFYVHPVKKVFKCFGCGVGGDVFDFVMLIWGCDFLDAL